jgi:MFS family permease
LSSPHSTTTVRNETPSPEQLPPRPLTHHLALTVYWLSNTILWGAMFHQALGLRLTSWYGEDRIGFYFGVLGFAGGIVGTAAQIAFGALSDRSLNPWGRRRPYIAVGSILAAGALLLLGASKSFWPFAGALMLVQLFTNVALGPFTALLPDTVNPREHGKASGFMGIARLLGDTGGLILAGTLLSLGPLANESSAVQRAFLDGRMSVLWAIIAGLIVVTMLFTCWAIRERPLRSRPQASTWQIIRRSFNVDLRGNVDFFWLTVSRAVTNIGFYMFLVTLLLFIKYTLRDPDPARATMLVMLPAIGAGVLASIPSGILSDRIGRRRLIFVAQFLMAAGATGFVFAPNLTAACIASIPAGLAYGVFTAVEWALACNLLPRGEPARYLGVWNASAVVPQIVGFLVAGAVGGAISKRVPGLGWRVDFAIAVVCCLVGAYFLIFVRERRRQAAQEPA